MSLSYLIVIFLFSCGATQKPVKYENCGDKSVAEVRVDPCSEEPCKFRKGSSPTLSITFTSNQDADRLKLSITADVAGLQVKFPGLKPDGCVNTGLECPLKKGQKYNFDYKIKILPFFPSINTTAKMNLSGPKGTLLCVIIPVQLV